MMYNGKNPLLPPKIPLSGISPSFVDYIPRSTIGSGAHLKAREDASHHQRTSSESFLMDEQPSWLDDLLDEPEIPVRKGHRRSTSDSFTYRGSSNIGRVNFVAQADGEFKNVPPFPSSGSQNIDVFGDIRHNINLFSEPYYSGKANSNMWDLPNIRSDGALQDAGRNSSSFNEKHEPVKSVHHDPKNSEEFKDVSYIKSSDSEADTRRAKQRYAQRSRVRKLQYIAELERHVQALQAEGSDVSAELEFLNQQNIILNMENNTLKQRLENLSQEQIIKHLEHEVLEREVVRLRNLYLQQQQPPQQPQKTSTQLRNDSKDIEQQLSTLSLKNREPSPGRDSIASHSHS